MLLTIENQLDVRCEWVTRITQLETSAGQIEQVTKSIFCRPVYKSPQDVQKIIIGHERALQIARATSEDHVIWESLINLGIAWGCHKLTEAGAYFGEAVALASTFQDHAVLAYSLNQTGNWLTAVEQPFEAINLHQQAFNLYQELEDQHGIAMTFYALGSAFGTLGYVEKSVSYYRQASSFYRAVKDRVGLILTLSMCSTCGTQYLNNVSNGPGQDLAQCVQDGEEALCIAQEIGWHAGESLALISLGLALSSCGQYGRALRDVYSGLQIATELITRNGKCWQTSY